MRDQNLRVRRLPIAVRFGGFLAALIALAGCAPEPVAPAAVATPAGVPAITIVAGTASTGDDIDPQQQLSPTVPLRLFADTVELDQLESQLLPLRIRSDAVGFTARYVSIPGAPAFTKYVDDKVRNIIAASGVNYTPAVYGTDAGLDKRGCVQGSATWDAEAVLLKPETAPPAGRGTALVCDLVGAFENTLAVVIRTVTGSPDGVTSDVADTVLVDTSTGAVSEHIPLWADNAASEVWAAVVELQREKSRVRGSVEALKPTAVQLNQMQESLDAARFTTDGGATVTLQHDSITSPFSGVNDTVSTEAVTVKLSAERVEQWSSEQRRALFTGEPAAFAGIKDAWYTAAVDCSLLPCVAVTYDDGPGPYTEALLATLAEHKGRATFYMLGAAAQGAPEVVQHVARSGHELGSHTMSHPDLTLMSPDEARAQVHDATRVLQNISGQAVATYRPPYGSISAEAQQAIAQPAVLWNIDTNDWRHPGVPALIERSVPVATPGSIILFHDVHPETVTAAAEVYAGLHQRGFVTVTVSQLFGGTVPTEVVRSR